MWALQNMSQEGQYYGQHTDRIRRLPVSQRIQVQEEVLPTFGNLVVWVQAHSQTKSMEAESISTRVEHPGQSKQ